MELNVRSDRKIVEIWLTRDEKQSERVQKELKLVYQSFKGTGYTVVAFLSGEQSLEDAVRLMCQAPSWAAGLPLNADGFEGDYYKKE